MRKRLAIYWHDLRQRGISYFVSSRLKKHSFTRRLYYLGRQPVVRVRGKKSYVDIMDSVVSERLLAEGVWEPYVTQVFEKYAGGKNLVLDIGAHIGYYSLVGSLKVGEGGRVIAFEPSEHNAGLLKKTLVENGITNVVVEQKAVGARTGEGKIYFDPENMGDNRTYDSGGEPRRVKRVQTVALDNYFSRYKGVIDLMKIDIQGYELQALRGMMGLLSKKRISVIISELWPEGLAMAGGDWRDYIRLLRKNGFKIWQIDEERGRLAPFSEKIIEQAYAEDKTFTTNILGKMESNSEE